MFELLREDIIVLITPLLALAGVGLWIFLTYLVLSYRTNKITKGAFLRKLPVLIGLLFPVAIILGSNMLQLTIHGSIFAIVTGIAVRNRMLKN